LLPKGYGDAANLYQGLTLTASTIDCFGSQPPGREPAI
jgi:hypothetical protein